MSMKPWLLGALIVVGIILFLIGIIVYGNQINKSFSSTWWIWLLMIVGGILVLVSVILLIWHLVSKSGKHEKQSKQQDEQESRSAYSTTIEQDPSRPHELVIRKSV